MMINSRCRCWSYCPILAFSLPLVLVMCAFLSISNKERNRNELTTNVTACVCVNGRRPSSWPSISVMRRELAAHGQNDTRFGQSIFFSVESIYKYTTILLYELWLDMMSSHLQSTPPNSFLTFFFLIINSISIQFIRVYSIRVYLYNKMIHLLCWCVVSITVYELKYTFKTSTFFFFWLVELPRRLLLFMVVVVVVVVVIRSFCSRPTKLDSTGPTLSNLANVTIVIY